ncbi:MAG TPA: hypothetical protein VNW92_12510 [Polyangiaceae bacterium]|jgi:hypothetical protein|nr:hypothetical protein [Polyangiaceae bacterium]
MRGSELLEWLSTLPAGERDRALEEHLGIAEPAPDATPPGPDLIGYHASGVAAIVRALATVPVQREDVFVDLGAGLGKVVLAAHLLTGATARGVELQPALAERAQAAARRLGAAVELSAGDAQNADLASGTVFYLYAPFTGAVLSKVLARLLCVASEHAIVVCALGVDLDRAAPWLVPRPGDSFWLTIYDSAVRGVPARRTAQCALPRRFTDIVASEA